MLTFGGMLQRLKKVKCCIKLEKKKKKSMMSDTFPRSEES